MNFPFFSSFEQLKHLLPDILRRVPDTTAKPLFIDPINLRVGIMATAITKPFQVSSTAEFDSDTIMANATAAAIQLTASGANNADVPTKAYVDGKTGGSITSIQTFTASGNFTWTKPSGISKILVQIVGGGGGGGDDQANAGSCGGGGSGGFCSSLFDASSSATASGTIGSGGAAGSNGPGGQGGDTIFLNMTASGGAGGLRNQTGAGGNGGVGGSATGGTINLTGNGGSGGNNDAGAGACGGGSLFGGGGRGEGENAASAGVQGGGGGGSKAKVGGGSSAAKGGTGMVIVYEYS